MENSRRISAIDRQTDREIDLLLTIASKILKLLVVLKELYIGPKLLRAGGKEGQEKGRQD